jgi:hypothetical protein
MLDVERSGRAGLVTCTAFDVAACASDLLCCVAPFGGFVEDAHQGVSAPWFGLIGVGGHVVGLSKGLDPD